jgi:hypothetical protein
MNHSLDQQGLRQVEEARIQALLRGEYDSLEQLISEHLVYHHTSGAVDGKQSYIAALRSGRTTFRAIEQSHTAIVVVGSTGLCRGNLRADVLVAGAPTSFVARYFNVWAWSADRWQMVAWSSAKPAEPQPPAAAP